MPNQSIQRQIIVELVIVVLLPVILFGGIYYFRNGPGFGDDADIQAASTEMRSQKVREAFATVDAISPLDPTIFRSAEWDALVDFTSPIPAVDVGRSDPFTRPAGVKVPLIIEGGQ